MHPMQKYREQAGLSITDLATRLDVDRTTVWRWEHGQRELKASQLPQIAKILGCRPGDLIPHPEEDDIQR